MVFYTRRSDPSQNQNCLISGFFFIQLFLALVRSGADHQLGLNQGIKLLLSQSIELQSTLLEGKALLVSVLGNLASHIVTDLGVEAGNKHETVESS